MPSVWIFIAAMLVGAAGGSAATWGLARAPLQGRVADLRQENAALRETHAEAARLSALAAARRIAQAQQAGQAAEARLTTTLAANARLTQEKKDALATATDGRACLDERALRVLDGAPGITVDRPHGADLPAPAGPAAAAPAGIATDTGVAGWIADAGKAYEACREQLHELIDWQLNPWADDAPRPHQQEPQGGPAQ